MKFNSFEELKEAFDSEKYDICYNDGKVIYEVRHLGSTIYCHDNEKNCGMGAVQNYDINGFYAVEKPKQDSESDPCDENTTQEV